MPNIKLVEKFKKYYKQSVFKNNTNIKNFFKKLENTLKILFLSFKYKPVKTKSPIYSYHKALFWIKQNSIPNEGIIVTSNNKKTYLEVTGYLIPTLINAGEHYLAESYSDYLSKIQQPNGAYLGPDGREYIFDSAQALKGLLAASHYWGRFKPYAFKTLNYIISLIEENGQISSIYSSDPSGFIQDAPDFIHVYILPVLVEASEVFKDSKYLKIAKKSLQFYKNHPSVLKPSYLTHFLAYIIDGFIDMGEIAFVRPIVKQIFSLQGKDGRIPAFPNVKWICSTGIAQFSIIGYKLGMYEEADKCLRYLCKIQNPSGGFFGSYGFLSNYFPGDEISWANKFFIDAVHYKIRSFFNRYASSYPTEISLNDGRLQNVLNFLGNLNFKKVLDAGCGKGRFAIKLKDLYPDCEVHGMDISEKLLQEIPNNIITKQGTILNLPYDTASFDGVYCIEVLEHAIRIEKAIQELCRVLKNDGRLIIIDKNIEKLGRLEITDFEQWFDKDFVQRILEKYCSNVQVKEISYENNAADGLFLAWTGIKKSII